MSSKKYILIVMVILFFIISGIAFALVSGLLPFRSQGDQTQDWMRLQGKTWVAVSIQIDGEIFAIGDNSPTLQFINADEVGGNGGCNSYSGPFTLGDGSIINFGPLASTLMACDAMEVETAYFHGLEKVVKYTVSESTLVLTSEDGKTSIQFSVNPE